MTDKEKEECWNGLLEVWRNTAIATSAWPEWKRVLAGLPPIAKAPAQAEADADQDAPATATG